MVESAPIPGLFSSFKKVANVAKFATKAANTVKKGVNKGVKETKKGVTRGVKETKKGVQRGVKETTKGVKTAVNHKVTKQVLKESESAVYGLAAGATGSKALRKKAGGGLTGKITSTVGAAGVGAVKGGASMATMGPAGIVVGVATGAAGGGFGQASQEFDEVNGVMNKIPLSHELAAMGANGIGPAGGLTNMAIGTGLNMARAGADGEIKDPQSALGAGMQGVMENAGGGKIGHVASMVKMFDGMAAAQRGGGTSRRGSGGKRPKRPKPPPPEEEEEEEEEGEVEQRPMASPAA